MSLDDQDNQGTGNGRHYSRLLPVLFIAAICALVLYEAATSLVEQGNASGSPIQNAALYPKLLAILLFGMLGIQMVSDLKAVSPPQSDVPNASGRQNGQILFTAIAVLFYMIALPSLGFILATPVFVLALLLVFGDRNPVTLVTVPPAVSVGCLIVFQGFFNVNVPRGILGIAVNF